MITMINLVNKKIRKFFNVFSMYMGQKKALTFPVAMQIEVVCGCNLNCKMCILSEITRQQGKMSFQTFKDIYDQIRPENVVLTGYGETLLNKDAIKMIGYAKRNKSSVHMDTNGTLINKVMARKLIRSGIDVITVSVDAATKKTYDKIRVGSDYQVVWSNLKTMIQLKKEMRSKSPIINLSCVVQPSNFGEMDKIIQAGYELGGFNVLFGLVTDYGDNKEGVYSFWKKIEKKTVLDSFDSALKKGKKLGLRKTCEFLSKAKEQYIGLMNTKEVKMGYCFWPWSSVFITWKGYVKPCCYFYDKDMIFGDITKDKFSNIWNNRKYKKFRKNLVDDRRNYARCIACRNDETKLFSKINRYLRHVPFIKSKYM